MTDRPFSTSEYDSTVGQTTTDSDWQTGPGLTPSISSAEGTSTTYGDSAYGDTTDQGAKEKAKESAHVASDEAKSVAADAKQGTRQVADTAKAEARDVAHETKQQARQLFDQLRTEATTQASGQSQRASEGLRALADELSQMVAGTQQHGIASDVARQASDRAHGFADWLEQREPGDILNEARDFARRRPGTFLAAAAAIGFLGGRLTRGITADDGSSSSAASATGTAASLGEPVGYAAPAAYDTPSSYSTESTAYTDAGTYTEAGTYTDAGTYTAAPGTSSTASTDPMRSEYGSGFDGTGDGHVAGTGFGEERR